MNNEEITMKCNRCGKWAGAHAILPGQPTDHLCLCRPTTFDEMFAEHNLTPSERRALVMYLATLRAQKTTEALLTPNFVIDNT